MSKKQDENFEIPSKGELLLEIHRASKDKLMLLQKAELAKDGGDVDTAIKWYSKLIAAGKEELRIAQLHNRYHEFPLEIPPIVRPLLNAMLTQSDLWEAKGKISEAEKLQKRALHLAIKYLDPSDIANIERSLVSFLTNRGDFNKALVRLSSSRDFFEKQGDIILLARTTIDLADLLQWLGDSTRALSELEHVSKMIAPIISEGTLTQGEPLPTFLETITNIMSGKGYNGNAEDSTSLYRISVEIDFFKGLINKALGNFEEAEKLFKKVLPAYQKLGVGPAIEYQLAYILVKKGCCKEGLDYAQRLEPEITKHGLLRPKLAAVRYVESEALFKMGRLEESLSKLQEGIQDLSVYHDLDLLWKLQFLKAETFEALGEPEKALKAYKDAAETVNNLRKAPLGYRLDSTYIEDKLGLFKQAIVLACENGFAKECCEFMEMIKSRTLTINLSLPPGRRVKSADELEIKFDDLSCRLDALEYSGYKGVKMDELRTMRDALLVERDALLERIRFSNPHWRAMTKPLHFDLSKIADILSTGEQVALSLFYTPRKIVAVLIKEGRISVDSIEIPSVVKSRLNDYVDNLQSTYPNPLSYDLSNGLGIGAKHLIPEKLLTQALQSKRLIIVPHGLLHLVPWASLIFRGSRLFEYCPIGILPNLSCIPSLETDFTPKPEIALVGAPDYSEHPNIPSLPHAEREISEIENLYSSKSRIIEPVLSNKKAKEEEFWRLLKHKDVRGGILHIVCHATFEPDEPMNAGLLLVDSKIDAAEISRSKLEYNEVILSACSSGWRPIKVKDVELLGDDILGLPGAFLEAGISSVLVSIPRADDSAARRFMVFYHENRVRGKSPLAALQKTQMAMLSDQKHEPFTWIGFTVYGFQ